MKTLLLISAIVLLYIVPVILCWSHVKIAHSKGGRWENLDTCGMDILLCFIPVLNLIGTFIDWIAFPPKTEWNLNKFFNIKK